ESDRLRRDPKRGERALVDVRVGLVAAEHVRGKRGFEELEAAELLLYSLPVRFVRVAEARQAVAPMKRGEHLARPRKETVGPAAEMPHELRGRRGNVPRRDELLGELRRI